MRIPLLIALGAYAAASGGAALAQDAQTIAGAEIYREKCSECHGPRMVSTGAAFDLRELKADERPRFDQSVLEGKNQMPAWAGQLTPDDLDKLWAYVRLRAFE